MSDGRPCPFPAEGEKPGSSLHCIESLCLWHHAGEPICPHPRACDNHGGCAHPLNDSHEEWRELNG
jgi:hypothetical protein